MLDKGSWISRLSGKSILWASLAIVLGSAATQGAVKSCPRPQPPASERVCRLQGIRRVAEPRQQRSLNRLMAELNAAVGSAERSIAAFRGQRGRMELHSAAHGQSLDELSRAAEAMRAASRVERAQEIWL